MSSTRIILGSQSPRRKELLDKMGLAGNYDVIPSGFDEYLDDERLPNEVAEELGYGKALWVAERNPEAWVIGSDTIVTVDGKQLGKAANIDEARDMLKLCAERPNTVTTSLALVQVILEPGGNHIVKHHIGHEEAIVHFKPYDAEAVEAYLATNDWKDKAGAWGIQSGAHTLIDYIQGNYDAIIGLPTHTLAEYLSRIGVDAKPVDLESPVPSR
jgi:septum formation protein